MNKNKRAALFAQQDGKCALCGERCPTAKGLIYVPDQNALLCRICGSWMSNHRNAISRGLTVAQLDAFLARSPAPELAAAPERTVRLKPGQIQGLADCLSDRGSLTLAEWCGRAGITEDEAMQYARQHGMPV